ncbi:MAG: YdcF family protein [Aquirufa sp.]
MFFILSKILDFLLQPLCWIFLLLGFAYFTRFSKRLIAITIALLLVMTNGWFVNQCYLAYETPQTTLKKPYQWCIILGGGMIRSGEGYRTGETADRFVQPLLLYKKGMVKKLLITGGNVNIKGLKIDDTQESKKVKEVLIAMGVAENDIYLEENARNTHENATYTKKMLAPYLAGEMVLVTSAMHMPRAKACYIKEGFRVVVYPADIKKKDTTSGILDLVIPQERNLSKFAELIREMAGFVIYKVVGFA